MIAILIIITVFSARFLPITASSESATVAETDAVWIGKSDFYNKVPSTVFFHLTSANVRSKDKLIFFCWGYEQRLDTKLRPANICVTQNAYYVNTSNLSITENIFDCAMCQHIFWNRGDLSAHSSKETHIGLKISGNSYYQKHGSFSGRCNRFSNVSSGHFDYAGSTESLRRALIKMDSSPKTIQWVNRAEKL